MSAFTCKIALVILLLGQIRLPAQDFLLRGCYAACQDSAVANRWMQTLRAQAPDLAYRGFTYLWLPKVKTEEQEAFSSLTKSLRNAGIQPMMDLTIAGGDAIFQLMPLSEQLRNDYHIKSFRIISTQTPKPVVVANFLNEYHQQNPDPALVFADISDLEAPEQYAQWVSKVIQNLPEETRQNILPRVYDYPLQTALRLACTDPTFDVRSVFTGSLRDATTLIGYNIITGINKEPLLQTEEKTTWVENPLLAYAYLLTNNQIGLPEIFYADYFGKESGNLLYQDKQALKKEIDQLIKVHQEYIFNSTEIEYLNRIDTDKKSRYLSEEAGADRALIFQLDGMNTPASQASKKPRDVLVAINFADVPLKVIQEVNLSHARPGDVFTDVLGRSAESSTRVQTYAELDGVAAVYLELPPRSYSIWVQGDAAPVMPGSISLSIASFDDFVELAWEVPAEQEIKHYEVQKSINGSPFQKITTLNVLGEAGASYLYTDEERLPTEEVTYRIKSVLKNGTASYSTIQTLKPVVTGYSFELLDHAKPGIKTIKIKSDQQSEGTFALFNADGKQVMLFTQPIKKGVSLAQIDLTALPKGIYLLNITAKNKIWTKKIINR